MDDVANSSGLSKSTEDSSPLITMSGMDSNLDTLSSGGLPSAGGLYSKSLQANRAQEEASKREAVHTDRIIGSLQDDLHKTYKDHMPAAVQTTPPPKEPENNPFQRFGSFASMIGIAASALTKKPIVNALNASASAMKAQREGDLDAYDREYEKWQDNTKLAFDKHKADMEDLQVFVDQWAEDASLSQAKMKAWAAANGSDAARMLADVGSAEEVQKFVTSQKDALLKGQLASEKIQDLNFKLKARDASVAADLEALGLTDIKNATPQQRADIMSKAEKVGSGKMTAGGTLDTDTIQRLAEQAIEGDDSALRGLGYGAVGAANRAAVNEDMTRIMKERGYSPDDIIAKRLALAGKLQSVKTASQQEGRIGPANIEAEQMADLALDASENVARTDFVPFTRAQQAVQTGTSSPAMGNFVAATNSFVQAYTRAISPIGAPTDIVRRHAYGMLDTAMGPDAYKSVIGQLKKEMAAAESSPLKFKEKLLSGELEAEVNKKEDKAPEGLPKGSVLLGKDKKSGKSVYQDPKTKQKYLVD